MVTRAEGAGLLSRSVHGVTGARLHNDRGSEE